MPCLRHSGILQQARQGAHAGLRERRQVRRSRRRGEVALGRSVPKREIPCLPVRDGEREPGELTAQRFSGRGLRRHRYQGGFAHRSHDSLHRGRVRYEPRASYRRDVARHHVEPLQQRLELEFRVERLQRLLVAGLDPQILEVELQRHVTTDGDEGPAQPGVARFRQQRLPGPFGLHLGRAG